MESAVNLSTFRGTLATAIQYSHDNHEKHFYRFFLDIQRLSGNVDTLPIVADEAILPSPLPQIGDSLLISGQIRSHNLRQDGSRHLMVFLFASEIAIEDGDPINDVSIEGVICREPNLRRTPMGRNICDLMLAVPRAFQRADYLPCILWGRTAQEAINYHTRDCIRIQGRMQSRKYNKLEDGKNVEHTAYEISALNAQFITE